MYLHFDSSNTLRYTRSIAALNDRYGWHLDAQKVLSKLGKKLGKKCGGGWISPEKRCKSHYTNGKLNTAGKSSGENLADRIRQRKGLSTISDRDGKSDPVTYAFLPGNQKSSTMTARRTNAKRSRYQAPDRLARLSATEERRSLVGLGVAPGRKVAPDSMPMMDMGTPKPRSKGSVVPVESGKPLKSLFSEADRIGAKYQTGPATMAERRIARQGADKILQETGYNEAVARASGAASMAKARDRKLSAGDKIRAIADKLKDEQNIQKFATGGIIKAAGKIYQNQNDLIEEVAAVANSDLDRKAEMLASAAQRQAIADAPVRIPNQRSSSEPRRRGRSVD